MKKITLLIIVCISIIGSITAQSNDIEGIWKLTETHQYGDLTKTYIFYLTFKDNGVIETGLDDGLTWLKNESENMLTINGSRFEGIEGENKIETLNDKELKLKNSKDEIISLQRVGLPNGKELNNKFTGEWMLEKVEKDGKTDFMSALIDLNSNGIFYFGGYMFGEWNYNNTTEGLFFDTREVKDPFNGEHSILESNKSAFILDVEGAKMYFSKIDREKIAKENGASGLIGIWKHINKENSDKFQILTFKAPNELSYVVRDGYRQKGGGMWMFNKNDKTVILSGGSRSLEGLNKIVFISSDEFTLENNGTIYSFKKEESQAAKIERLTFSQDDFYDENEEFKYYDDEQKLPWENLFSSEMQASLANVTQLVYNHATLIDGTELFENKTLTADVTTSIDEGINIDNVFIGFDRYNVPEDTAFPSNDYDQYNQLYPLEDDSFRFVGNEEITTPAGTFNCTVLEVLSGSDEFKKLWMINDKPGVYAKIIEERTDDMYSYYRFYELQEIKTK